MVMSAPTVLLPFLMWYRSHSKYEELKKKKAWLLSWTVGVYFLVPIHYNLSAVFKMITFIVLWTPGITCTQLCLHYKSFCLWVFGFLAVTVALARLDWNPPSLCVTVHRKKKVKNVMVWGKSNLNIQNVQSNVGNVQSSVGNASFQYCIAVVGPILSLFVYLTLSPL